MNNFTIVTLPTVYKWTTDDCPGHQLVLQDIERLTMGWSMDTPPPRCVYCGLQAFGIEEEE